jgi:hypothetical protein
MRKSTILIVIGITSLVIMACGFGSAAQQKIETQPTIITTTEATTVESKAPVEIQPTEEYLAVVESQPTETVKPTVKIENTPTPTIDPLSSARNCLANTWEIEGLSDYVLASVPPELAKEYSLKYVETTGEAYLTLLPDGKVVLQAENLVFHFNARFAIFQVPVTVSIDGTAVGTYDIDTTTLRIDNMDTSGLTASAKAMDEDLMDPDQIINSIPFVRPPYNTAEYACQGDVLELELSGYQGNLPPLVFQAVK